MTNPPDIKPESEGKVEAPEHGAKRHLHHLREKSLKAAGIGCFLADCALLAYGFSTGEHKIGAAGAFGLTAGAVGTRYGNPKAEKQLEQIYHRLGDYLRKENIEIPKDPGTKELSRENGILDHIESFLYGNPSQVMNVLYSLVGVQFARAAMQPKKGIPGEKRALFGLVPRDKRALFGSGCFLIAGALAGLLLQEKKPDPEHPPQGIFQKAVSWIEEKPLRLTGTLFNVNQVLLTMNALEERAANPAKKSYVYKLLAVAGFTFGNTMLALSSKSHGGGSKMDRKTLNTLAETSARVIAAQPQKVQDALLEQIAGFLASQPNIAMSGEQLSQMMYKKLEQIAPKTPQAVGWQGRVAESRGAEPRQPSL